MRSRTSLIATGALLIQALGQAAPARAADPVVVSFTFTGAEQSWVVPADVTSIHVRLVGGKGGGQLGGFAHTVEGNLTTTPGTTLYLEVGGNGGHQDTFSGGFGGFNGGAAGADGEFGSGGGGGATDIRTVSRADAGTVDSRLIVAGGGGGSAGTGAAGGNAAEAGANGDAGGGQAGSQSSGGGGGAGFTAGGSGETGQPGGLGSGGQGGGGWNGGAGGGGGYFGGGGGGGAGVEPDTFVGFTAGGGGGGSSFTGDATNATVTTDSSGTPSITITYSPSPGDGGGSDTGTVDAVVTMADSAVCLELSTTSIDFGTRQFGDVGAPGTPTIGITNCGGVTETILARGTDATGTGPSAWSLVETGGCVDATLGLDEFRLRLEDQATENQVTLSTTNTTLQALPGGAGASHVAHIDTPCPGSSGAGAVMGMQIVFVATE